MRTESVLRMEAMQYLIEKLGEVDAERFVSLINREHFDYTRWRKSLWADRNIDEIYNAAKAFYETNPS